MNIHQLISVSVSVSIYLLLSTGSNAFSSLSPPPVQPPPVVNTPPSFLQPGGATAPPNTPWALCQSLPQDCIIGGSNAAPPPSFGSQSCPTGSILISNQCVPVTSPGMTTTNASPSISGAPSNGCLPGELAENNLCIHAQSPGTSPQLQPQQQQLQPQLQPQGLCPQGTILENNLCFPQQQVPTANFTSPGQQLATPHASSNHNSTSVVSNMESFQRSGNGTNIEKNCITANQSGSDCNTKQSNLSKH